MGFYDRKFVSGVITLMRESGATGVDFENAKASLIEAWVKGSGDFLSGVKDTRVVGRGNAAARRQGIDTRDKGCNCDTCVVYGGDCSYVMYEESRREWHREQRGKKTRLARILAERDAEAYDEYIAAAIRAEQVTERFFEDRAEHYEERGK